MSIKNEMIFEVKITGGIDKLGIISVSLNGNDNDNDTITVKDREFTRIDLCCNILALVDKFIKTGGIDLFCGECKYLNIIEKEQKSEDKNHYCKKYEKRIFHGSFHPKLIRPEICKKEGI